MEPANFVSERLTLSKAQGEFSSVLELPEIHRRFQTISPLSMGIAIAILLMFVLLVGPALAQFSPSAVNSGPRLSPPGPEHWFGTDPLGRDLFSRVVHGFRVSLVISLAATLLAALPGVGLGLVSGFYQGWIDQLLSRMVEVLLALPGLLLAIVLITRLGSSLPTLIFALGVTGIPTFFRITRNETLSMSKQLFVEASRSLGISTPALITRHIFPNIFPTLLVLTSMRMGIYLLMGSGLGFIGLGIQPPLSELGALLASGKEYYQTAWWLYTFPAAFIFSTVLGFNLLGEGLRDCYTRH
jgi:ABC-type dipeptide/oligopeptide/nickel transport system permease subunit